ncbi:DUF4129 domain-containing protein [Arthrobacter sp. TWP1-1]|uniref:DUF4129 domain-containing protein n=1 Tax=Arthrobacter sp. TWP1-1 TaxID=2804568 RepID=UPI003CF4762E
MASSLTTLASLPTLLPIDIPVVPGADEARQWAQEELARKAYQDAKPGLAEQIGALIKSAFNELFNNVSGPNGSVALAIGVGVVLLAIVAIIFIIRPRLNRKIASTEEVFAGARLLSAEQHRALARTAASAGDFHTAVTEQFRAMIRSAEERDVSLPAVGRTAVEIAVQLERAFPAHGEALHHSAEVFNAVRYGKVTPTAAMYNELTATDQAVSATKPVYADDGLAVQP